MDFFNADEAQDEDDDKLAPVSVVLLGTPLAFTDQMNN